MSSLRPMLFAVSLGAVDWTVIALYGLGMLAVGLHYARRTSGAEDYLLGARRLNPLGVGLSLFASLLSTLSYLGYTGEMIRYGPMYLAGVVAFPLVFFLVGWCMIPYFMSLRVTSAYEILEKRFGRGIGSLGSFFFLSLRLLWMAAILFATTDTVLVPLLGLSSAWTPVVCAVMGLLTVIYTGLGGLRAVVFTDVVQSLILFMGALLTIFLISRQLGGAGSWWVGSWPGHWPEMRWGLDPGARMSFIGVLLSVFFWHTCTAGSDQIAIQRYFATRDARSARQVLGVHLLVGAFAMALMGVVGLALLAIHRAQPDRFAGADYLGEHADRLFPAFIASGLPAGLAGLVIAGLLAAAMSSLSSGMNSSAAVITAEWRKWRPVASGEDPASGVRAARWVSLLVGTAALGLSLLVGRVEGNLFQVAHKVVNLFVAPLFVLFFLALFIKRSTAGGVWCAAAAAVAAAVSIAFWEEFTGREGISFLWIMPASFAAGVAVGWAGGFLRPETARRGES